MLIKFFKKKTTKLSIVKSSNKEVNILRKNKN